jgi:hypothetical protein
LFAAASAACGTGDSAMADPAPGTEAPSGTDPGASDPAPDPMSDPALIDQQLEQSGSGGLNDPLIYTSGASTVTVIDAVAGGPGAQITGGTDLNSYALAQYRGGTGATNATAEFTVNPAPGSAFAYELVGSGSGYSSKLLHFERLPGSESLDVKVAGVPTTCGATPSGAATTVTVSFDGAAQTFDVLIGGAATPCTGMSTRLLAPIKGFRLLDTGGPGYGGQVVFSDLQLF